MRYLEESAPPQAPVADAVSSLLAGLGLESVQRAAFPGVVLVHHRNGEPLAALLPQGARLREDRDAINALKSFCRRIPIIYLARSSNPRRETAIRRSGIHYFLASSDQADELRLVLEALVGTRFSLPFERFFSR